MARSDGGRVLPGPGAHAADVELLHLEELAGRGEGLVGLRHRHGGRIPAGRAHVASFLVTAAGSKIAAR